jgi:hypothetical protein
LQPGLCFPAQGLPMVPQTTNGFKVITMIDIDVRSNIKNIAGVVRHLDKRAVKWSTTLALTRTAWDAQKKLLQIIPHRFKITKTWWTARQPTGIKVNKATMQKLRAEVFTEAYFLPLHETGGTKRPHRGRSLFIPTANTPQRGRKSGGHQAVLAGKKVLRKGGTATGSPFATVNGKTGVFRRKTKKRYPLEMVYATRPQAHIDPRFGFEKTVRAEVAKVFDKHFYSILDKELKSKR